MQAILIGILTYMLKVFIFRGCPTMSMTDAGYVAGLVFIILYFVDKPLPLPI
jgi:ammonia channel protein AmtB